jgi:hypothetical protein
MKNLKAMNIMKTMKTMKTPAAIKKSRRLSHLVTVASLGLALLAPGWAQAQDDAVKAPLGMDNWVYKMGGADSFLFYRQPNRTNIDFGAGADWQLFRSCSFDPHISIQSAFDNIENSVYGILNNMEDVAKNLATTYALFRLQESFPTAYNFLMDNGENAMAQFSIGMKTCRDFQRDLRQKRDPSAGWISYGRDAEWSGAAKAGDQDVVKVADKAERQGGDRGVPWINGGNAGGKNQSPIRVIGDVMKKGYQQITAGLNAQAALATADNQRDLFGFENPQQMLDAGGGGGSGGGLNPDLDNENLVFKTAEDAQKWMKEVVGEREIKTCTDCDKLKVATGQGLRLQVVRETDTATQQVTSALQSAKPSVDQINALTVDGMGFSINGAMLRALRGLEPRERGAILGKLSSEIGMMRAINKALAARDILNAGMQDPNVIANEQAMTELTWSKNRLDEEINNLMFEADIRKKVFSPTALVLSELAQSRESTGKADSDTPLQEGPSVDKGGFYPTGAGDE